MAYSQSKELTDTEKRLQALKIQLFGKEQANSASTVVNKNHKSTMTNLTSTTTISHAQHQDLTYLKKDLLKITTLTAIALFVQLMLKFIVKI